MRLRPLLIALLALLGLLVLGLVAWCIQARFVYPHELSKMEGGFVDHARRAAAGRPLFAPPSAEFVPFLYMPLYHHVAAWVMRLGFDGFAATRLVSLLGIVGSIGVGMVLVARATGRRAWALLVAPLAAAKYFDVQCFYDQARPDNLMVLFCLGAAWALTIERALPAVLSFAVAGTLAFLTKQSAALFLVVLLAGALCVRWRVALAAGAAWAVLAGAAFLLWNRATDGWLERYCIVAPSHHYFDYARWFHGFYEVLLGSLFFPTLVLVVATLAVALTWREARPGDDARGRARLIVVAGALAAAAFASASSSQPLAMRNVFVISALFGAALVPIVLQWLVESVAAGRRRELVLLLVLAALCLEVGRGLQQWRLFVPTGKEPRIWQELYRSLARHGPPERTWITAHGATFGARPQDVCHVHVGALFDYVGGLFGGKTEYPIPVDLQQRIDTRYYDAIAVGSWDYDTQHLIAPQYALDPDAPEVRLPMFTGRESGHTQVWIRKPEP